MPIDGHVDAFLQLIGPNGQISGQSTDKWFPGTIQIADFELSSRPVERMIKEGQDDDEERTLYKSDQTELQILNHRERKRKGEEPPFTLKIKKDLDTASADLAQSYAQNLSGVRQAFPKATLSLRKSGTANFVYLTMVMQELYVINYQLNAGGKGTSSVSIPEEHVTFNFRTCIMQYAPQTPTGGRGSAKTAGWDFQAQKQASM